MYGESKHTEHPTDAMALMQAVLKDSAAASTRFNSEQGNRTTCHGLPPMLCGTPLRYA